MSIHDWIMGPMTPIELDKARALELAIMPVGIRLVVAVTVEDIAFGIEVVAGTAVLDGTLALAETEPGEAVEETDPEDDVGLPED